MTLTIGADRRDVLLRSLPANSARIWIRITGDKHIYIDQIMGLGPLGFARFSSKDDSAEFLPPGVYQLDINKNDQLLVSPGSLDDASQVIPLWDITVLALCDRLKLINNPNIERENKMLDQLIRSYNPVAIPGKYNSSPALMSLFSIGYAHGWFSRAIPEVEFDKVDYLLIEPNVSLITNKNELLPFHDTREIFKEAFKAGWDNSKDVMLDKQ